MGRIVSINSQKENGVNANIILKTSQHRELIAKLHKKLGRPITAYEIRTILYDYVKDVDISGDEPLPSPNLDKVKETVNAPTPTSKPIKMQTELNNGLHTVKSGSYGLDPDLQQVDNVLYDTLGYEQGYEQGEQDDTFCISDDDF